MIVEKEHGHDPGDVLGAWSGVGTLGIFAHGGTPSR
jgi:hypothetical protein